MIRRARASGLAFAVAVMIGPAAGPAASASDRLPVGATVSPVAKLLRASQQLREAIHAMAEAPAGERRTQAIERGNRALLAVHQATAGLPAGMLAGSANEGEYRKAVRELQSAAQRLREAAQQLASGPASERRSESIRAVNDALQETNEAMLQAAASGGGRAVGSVPSHPGRVEIDIGAVAPQLATRLGVDSSRIPATVWLPAGQAAGICEVPVAELTPPSGQPTPACDAASAAPALEEALRIELALPGKQLR